MFVFTSCVPFLFTCLWSVFMFIIYVCLFVCFWSCAQLFVRSSDSSDSRLPIIRRGEGSTEETYDESYGDDREYQEHDHSLSSDMYCWNRHTHHNSSDFTSKVDKIQGKSFINSSLFLCILLPRLVYHDDTCKQLTPMEEGEEVEDRRGGGGWQSPRRVFLCPTSLGE